MRVFDTMMVAFNVNPHPHPQTGVILIIGRTEKANELALILAVVLSFYTALGQGGVNIHRPTHNTYGSILGESKKNCSLENYLLLKDG
jgi:hypothetical protein